MDKNGVIAVVVVVTAIVLVGLWAMRSGQQRNPRADCTAPPGAPTDVRHTVEADTVAITWTAPDTSDPVTTYVIEAGDAPGQNATTFIAPGTATEFQRQAPPGTYYVRVLARNPCGMSPPSSELQVVVR